MCAEHTNYSAAHEIRVAQSHPPYSQCGNTALCKSRRRKYADMQYTSPKWRWAGPVARRNDDRWTKALT